MSASFLLVTLLLSVGLPASSVGWGQSTSLGPLEPMIAPSENPTTPAKVILGKMLFWDAQLSSDNSVACGSCHLPSGGGADPRAFHPTSIHPGADAQFGTADDHRGSIGLVRQDCDANLLTGGFFYPDRQVTQRRAPSAIGVGYTSEMFWDGRADGTVFDPLTGTLEIPFGGSLESQAMVPILSSVEMACDGRQWSDVIDKLATVTPLGLAESVTPDIADALVLDPTYPDLFENAFGSPRITPIRIAFALASYERILLPNQTPFDAFMSGDLSALTTAQQNGLQTFMDNCEVCHSGSAMTDNFYHNIGVRPWQEDLGREGITGDIQDRGAFKTPPLRNVSLRAPYFHNGGKQTLQEVVEFYRNGGDFTDFQSNFMTVVMFGPSEDADLVDFLQNALTDPRLELGLAPFDHPQLRPYFRRGDIDSDGSLQLIDAILLLRYLFQGEAVACEDAADADDSGTPGIGDAFMLLGRLFLGDPPLPSPSALRLGPDPTPDALGCATPPI